MKIEKQYTKFIKPFVPTPPTHRRYKLGFIDEFVPVVVNASIVLFFSTNSMHNQNFIPQLENSLRKTLTRFYPLAGKYVNENHTVDCSDQGVEFIYAKVNTKLQDMLLSDAKVNLIDEFIKSKDDESLLATQVTTFEGGGVALAVNASHKIVDASTLSTFINEWAVINREENDNDNDNENPGFNSSSLFPGRGVCSAELQFISDDMLSKYTRKKFSFSESVIANMKVKIIASGRSSTNRLSKVQLVSAIFWKTLIDIDRIVHNFPRDSVFIQVVNLRDKMVSLIPKNSCGNLWGLCATESTTLETTGELLHILSDSVKKTITNLSKADHLHSEEVQTMVLNSLTPMMSISESTNVVMLTSWCKFPFYEADFGFGKPAWVAPGLDPEKNSVYLMDDVQGNGVEAYVFLEVKDVPYFEQALDSNAKIYGFSCV